MQWKSLETKLTDSIIINKYFLQLQSPYVMFYRTQQYLLYLWSSVRDSFSYTYTFLSWIYHTALVVLLNPVGYSWNKVIVLKGSKMWIYMWKYNVSLLAVTSVIFTKYPIRYCAWENKKYSSLFIALKYYWACNIFADQTVNRITEELIFLILFHSNKICDFLHIPSSSYKSVSLINFYSTIIELIGLWGMQVVSASCLQRGAVWLYSFSHVFLIILDLKVKAVITNLYFDPTKVCRTYVYEFMMLWPWRMRQKGLSILCAFPALWIWVIKWPCISVNLQRFF